MDLEQHQPFMVRALALAEHALVRGDWPVAAVITRAGAIIGEGQGCQISERNPTRHAEIAATEDALARGHLLSGATIYCTMEPCPMCAFALHLHGISHVVLGARHHDLGRTDLGSYSLERFGAMMGYSLEIVEGVCQRECIALRKRWGGDIIGGAAHP